VNLSIGQNEEVGAQGAVMAIRPQSEKPEESPVRSPKSNSYSDQDPDDSVDKIRKEREMML